jgi:glycosyltransferase involved in cell wall biosynthesis
MKVARDRASIGELARERRAAIVHSNSSIIISGRAVAERAGSAHLQHVREIYDGSAGRLGVALWPLYRRHLLRSDALACVSRAAEAQFEGRGRAFVLRDGLTWEPRRAPRGDARRALGLEPGPFVVVVAGRVSDWKGQHVLARALAEPALAEIGAIGLVAGTAAARQHHYEHELIALRDELRLGDRFRLLGFRDDLDMLFGVADAVAAPSTHPDALPNAVLEAAASGVPVVATDIGGLSEIVRDGQTGRLVPKADPRQLAAALRELADDPGQARRLGDAAALDVRARFGLDRMLDAVEDRYTRLLERAGGR